MKRVLPFLVLAAALLLSACSLELYHMGGLKPKDMQQLNTFCVQMFENHSTQPTASMLLTNAVTDALQRDGTYKLATGSKADFAVSGEITHISRTSLLTDSEDSYLSREVGIVLHVRYTIKDLRTGKVIRESDAVGESSYFTTMTNLQSALSDALSHAARRAAEQITTDLTMP